MNDPSKPNSSKYPRPHEGITGTDRPGDPLLSSAEMSHLIGVLGYHLSSVLLLGQQAPFSETIHKRMEAPQPGDAVVVTDPVLRGTSETRHQGVGYLLEVRKEWWDTDEEWERQKAEDDTLAEADRMIEPAAWYIQYGENAGAVCRWVNCRVVAIPTDVVRNGTWELP